MQLLQTEGGCSVKKSAVIKTVQQKNGGTSMRLKKLISCVLSAAMLLTMTSMPVKAADTAETEAAHQLEATGAELRKLYSWNDGNKLIDK